MSGGYCSLLVVVIRNGRGDGWAFLDVLRCALSELPRITAEYLGDAVGRDAVCDLVLDSYQHVGRKGA